MALSKWLGEDARHFYMSDEAGVVMLLYNPDSAKTDRILTATCHSGPKVPFGGVCMI